MSELKSRSISIQYHPFPEESDSSKTMDAGKFLWPGFGRTFEVWCKPVGNKDYYYTGLEAELYPESEREEILAAKAELEKHYGKGMLEPTNTEFWKNIKLELTKKTTFLDLNSPDDKLTYYIIKGGGYQGIAENYEAAISGSIPKRWYMIDANDYADLNAADDKQIIKAYALLHDLDENKSFEDIFLVHKVLISADRGTTKNSPKGMLFKDLSSFVQGKLVKTNKKQTPKQFVDTVELLKKDKKKITITAYVKDAIHFNFLHLTEDNQFKNLQTGTKYGSSVDKIVSFLSNPANQSELENIKERVMERWNQ